jgi:hypothetical protein
MKQVLVSILYGVWVSVGYISLYNAHLPMQEASSLQEEQCNGQGHASIVENADFMPVLEGADGGSVQNTNIISDQGNAEHGSPRSGDGEDSKVQATSSDVGDDPVGPLP